MGKRPRETVNIAKIEKPVPLMWKLRQKTVYVHLDINLETDELSLTDESASNEFCFIIRLSTEFILETTYPSETGNPFMWIIRL